jgi:DNA-binding winged helix-turn-helix (wHTH) protein
MLYKFGEYALCPERYELTCRGGRISPEPRVLEVLGYLVANKDRVVPKGELFDRLWGGVIVKAPHTLGQRAVPGRASG